MKLLCVADMHLGRFPARLHPDLLPLASELGPAAAWRKAVDRALAEGVDAVLLAGDLVDGGDDFFEAYADLRAGVERLTAAGVTVVAVAGNHDVEVLPRLAEAVPGLRLLGRGGRWETCDLEAGGARVRVAGWSFPRRWVDASPLADGALAAALDAAGPAPAAVIGLLHADRDQGGSRYAPVASAELAAAPVSAWLLGHVHAPDLAPAAGAGARLAGYLGSLTSNDPGEGGARGAWLLEVAADGALDARHVPLAPLRWERVEVDVSGLAAAEDVALEIAAAVERLHERLATEGVEAVAVGCRLVLGGRTRLRGAIEAALAHDPPSARVLRHEQVSYFVDRVRVEALPELDLAALARGDDPVGLLAARIEALRQPGSPLRERLVSAARPRLVEAARAKAFAGLEPPALDEAEVAALLEEAALRALDALLSQPGSAA